MATGGPKISVSSLSPADKDGWLTKQGGSIKTWKRRWFVLKGDTLYYFKTQKDLEETGRIVLDQTSKCLEEPKKRKNCFSVHPTPDSKRIFYMFPDITSETQQWINSINAAIEKIKKGGSAPSHSTTTATTTTHVEKSYQEPATTHVEKNHSDEAHHSSPAKSTKDSSGLTSPRDKLAAAKDAIPFLQEEESKVLEFWQIWSESIPPSEDLQAGMAIEFHVSTSANMQKLTWRTAGPQNIFIQKMVDFFWNVGAPESEIDRLNDVGALINPIKIGSWIDMSAKGGMDGGWYFPVDIPMKLALEASDPGDPSTKLKQWAEKHNIEKCFSVGRDMGAAPPRQTELRIKIPGATFDQQLDIGIDAYSSFGFPAIPEEAIKVVRSNPANTGIVLSVITSSEGFVRLGMLTPKPNSDQVSKLCALSGATSLIKQLNNLESTIGVSGPSFVECQYLKEGFGYGVYKEGFDIVFHYDVGEEKLDE